VPPDPTQAPAALTIAGTDPTGGAGVELDLQVFALHAVHGMAVTTALNVQTTRGVHRTLPAFPNVVGEQLSLLLEDVRPDAIKIGMLATDDVLLRVAGVLERHPIPRVVDPILQASDGTWLLERRAWSNLADRVIAGAALVTPNRPEAEALTGSDDPERAAHLLLEIGAEAALVKGGHADGPPDDFLLSRDGGTWLRGEHHDVGPVHGTGCALSSAITARLARGEKLEEAVRGAKRFVASAIERSYRAGVGARRLGLFPAT
jgi:hydroxymethylpyrimidine/phosphomethylpyrimidine kinase